MNPRTAPARRQVEAVSDAVGVSRVGGRPIHAYWLLLAPHVRDVLLAPQRHLGDQKLGWSWDPPKDHVNESFSAAECADARQRLAAALERLRLELEESADPVASDERQRLLCQLSSSLDAWAAGLITGSDARVTGYLARTRHGLMFHSWGLAQPAQALAAPSLPGQGDAATAARASHQTTPQRRWRRWMIFLAIIATATLALVGGLRGCSQAPASATPAGETKAERVAEPRDNGQTAPVRQTEATPPPAAPTANGTASGIFTTGAQPATQPIRFSPATSAARETVADSRNASRATASSEAFEGRDAAPAVAAAGVPGATLTGAAAAGGVAGISMATGTGSDGAAATTGVAPGASSASSPVPNSSLHTSARSSTAGGRPAALPSGPPAAGDRATVAPGGDVLPPQDPDKRSPTAPEPSSPSPLGATNPPSADAKPDDRAAEFPDPDPEAPPAADERKTDSDPSNESGRDASDTIVTLSDVPTSQRVPHRIDPDDTIIRSAPGDERTTRTFDGDERSPAREQTEPIEALNAAAAAAEEARPRPMSAKDAAGLRNAQHVRLLTRNWRSELLRNAIVPTVPQEVGRADPVDQLRAELWQRHQAVRPAWMPNARIHLGITLSWPRDWEPGDPHLDGIRDGDVSARRISANALALTWPATGSPSAVTVSFDESGSNRPLAELRFAAGAVDAHVRQPLGLHAWISIDTVDEIRPAAHEWRLISGPALALPRLAPDANAARIILPTVARVGLPDVRSLAIVDRTSGWALVGEVETSTSAMPDAE